jgi:formylglycine-generating enzyme required for sulfatase activity
VSVEQFERFMNDHAYTASEKPSDWRGADKRHSPSPACPMQPTSWYDAILYCNWLSRQENLTACYRRVGSREAWELVPNANGYRLPTETEWEYACRAGSTTEYCCGNDTLYLASYAVYDTPESKTEPCASRAPNAWGLFDMHGNLMEWCEDPYRETYRQAGTSWRRQLVGSYRVLRGGSVFDPGSEVRSARREKNRPASRYRDCGFRVAR